MPGTRSCCRRPCRWGGRGSR
uniref:Uncharacterized protein n=1 Tax=Arundo donax TaxID=35708 RepID=A0A0A9F8C5_ARUDO